MGIHTESLNYVGVEVVTTVLALGVHSRGEVNLRTDLIAEARLQGGLLGVGKHRGLGVGHGSDGSRDDCASRR